MKRFLTVVVDLADLALAVVQLIGVFIWGIMVMSCFLIPPLVVVALVVDLLRAPVCK